MSDQMPIHPNPLDVSYGPKSWTVAAKSELPATSGSTFAFQEYVSKQQEWSARTFGDGPRTKGITAHIRKELEEVEAAPNDLEEWIDVMILALDGAWRCGGTPQTIAAMLERKQAKNFGRTYPKPLSQDHPSFHVKETSNGEVSRE